MKGYICYSTLEADTSKTKTIFVGVTYMLKVMHRSSFIYCCTTLNVMFVVHTFSLRLELIYKCVHILGPTAQLHCTTSTRHFAEQNKSLFHYIEAHLWSLFLSLKLPLWSQLFLFVTYIPHIHRIILIFKNKIKLKGTNKRSLACEVIMKGFWGVSKSSF